MGIPGGSPDIGGAGLVESFRALTAGVPWRSVTASMTLLDSHDTARFASMARRPPAHRRSASGCSSRCPACRWCSPATRWAWRGPPRPRPPAVPVGREPRGTATCSSTTRALIALRRGSRALREGSLRWVAATDDLVAFVREPAATACSCWRHAAGAPDGRASTPGRRGLTGAAQTLFGGTDLDRDGDVVRLAAADAEVHVWRLGHE